MRQVIFTAVAVLTLFTSCREIFAKRISGSGNITTQSRNTGQFSSIDVSGGIDLVVKQDATTSVKVEADDNLQQYIETITDGDVLRIKTQEGIHINSSKDIKVYVSNATFKRLEASGACEISGDGVLNSTSDLDIDLSGSCGVTLNVIAPKISTDGSGSCRLALKGQTKDFSISGSGSTEVKCFDLVADNVSIDLSGSGDVEVFANQKIDGDISGAGDVKYKGNAQTNIHTSGASSVNKVN